MALIDNHWFWLVKTHIDSMLSFGRGPGSPLFGGVIDIGYRKAVTALTPIPPGIRVCDFNWCGNNLMHDIPLLEVMIALTQLTGEPAYEAAVTEMLEFYVANCPVEQTGLFPWGEHGQWSFIDRGPVPCTFTKGMKAWHETRTLVHDHLRFAPAWFWERMWKASSEVVVKFAKGLNGHVVDAKTFEHNRHAALQGPPWRDPNKPDFDKGADFARHSGFYIFDTMFAYKHSGDASLLEWARRKVGWHLANRHPNGLLRGEVRTANYETVGQHDSLALSLADAADVLGRESAEGKEFAGYAEELFDARGRTRASESPKTPERGDDPRLWLNGYTRKNLLPERTLEQGNILRLFYERTKIPWYADQLQAMGRWCASELADPPANVPLMPRGFHQHIEMLLLAHQQSGDQAMLSRAEHLAKAAERKLWAGVMLKGISNMTWYGSGTNYEFYVDEWATDASTTGLYHSVTGTPLLVRTLLQLAMIQEGQPDILGPDPHRR